MPDRVYTFVVQEADIVSNHHEEKCRLDRYVLKQKDIDSSRSQVRKFILDGAITVNGHVMKPGYWVKAFDEITVTLPEPRPSSLVAEAIPLDIVYEDAQLLVINKPSGMVVHPAPGHDEGTLVHALLYHCQDLSGIGGIQRPGIVHRLDRDTSGLMLVAKTDDAHRDLSAQLSRHDITRIYYAVVHGRFAALSGRIEAPIGRHRGDRKKMAVVPEEDGRNALTFYQVLEQYTRHALLKIQLKTGRTHQIRVHLKYKQHPVVGDPVYGISSANNLGMLRQALHAKCLSFLHPATGEQMSFETSLPEDMKQLLEKLRGMRET